MTTYDGLTAEDLVDRLAVPRVVVFGETDSTLDVAHQLAQEGAPAGTVVVADTQRSGRGRMGRAWTSMPGRGVWCTIIERMTDVAALDVLSMRVGLLAAEQLDELAPARVRVKWPNDLMVAGRKLGGILCEARWSGPSPAWVAVGVGVNVQVPDAVEGACALQPGVARGVVLDRIVRAARDAASRAGPLTSDEVASFQDRDALAGARIASPAAGTVAGIAPSGALLVRTARGLEPFRSGTVRMAED